MVEQVKVNKEREENIKLLDTIQDSVRYLVDEFSISLMMSLLCSKSSGTFFIIHISFLYH
jgi:hypothetical protein